MNQSKPQEVQIIVGRMFREHYRYLTAALTASIGPDHLETAEDAVAEALLRALKHWPYYGVPKHPRAWLFKAAHNHCLDRLRRSATHDKHRLTLKTLMEDGAREQPMEVHDTFGDEALAMLFMVSHPCLSPDSRVTLALKVVGGFSVGEIARAFLIKESAVSQRLLRARRTLALRQVRFEIPPPAELEARLTTVLDVLYLMFTEGHLAHEGDALVRADICMEVLRMVEVLGNHATTASPRVAALAALVCLTTARLPGRTDVNGDLLLTADQDRSKWDQTLIAKGAFWLRRSGAGAGLTRYHLEAEIAACHTLAPSFESCDWETIVRLYDLLLKLKPSPIIALNRAVALEQVAGTGAALETLLSLETHGQLARYYPYHVSLATMYQRLNRPVEAEGAYKEALSHCYGKPVRAHLLDAIASLHH